MEITREIKMQMFCMHLDGMTLYEIAKGTGYSVEEVANAINIKARRSKHHYGWIYPGLEAWMGKNRITLQMFGDMCGVDATHVHKWLTGKYSITKANIDKILRATGMTYEEAFGDPRKESEIT